MSDNKWSYTCSVQSPHLCYWCTLLTIAITHTNDPEACQGQNVSQAKSYVDLPASMAVQALRRI